MENKVKDSSSNNKNNSKTNYTNLLSNKSSRNNHTSSTTKVDRKSLLRQLEFYFSDVNLINDKFLFRLIKSDPDRGVYIKTLLEFNKIKNLLSNISEEKKVNYIRKTVQESKLLKIKDDKVLRKENFEKGKIDQQELDSKTIYIENLPCSISHDVLCSVFREFGKILHISIPKFSESKKAKGFAFITFEKLANAETALLKKNNTLPAEFICKDFSNLDTEVYPLKIITKKEWLAQKEEFKKLKQELMRENKDIFTECLGQDSQQINQLKKGTLVKIQDIPVNKKVNRHDIKIWVANILEPAFVDYNSNNPSECIVRFSHPFLAENFINKLINVNNYAFYDQILKVSLVNEDEEERYFEKVEQIKQEKKKKKNK